MIISTIDIGTHSTSKFYFIILITFGDFGDETYEIRLTVVSHDLHTIEKLQSKNWPYFINRLLEVLDGGISLLNLINLSQNRNDANELEIINDTIENLEICKSYFLDIYANVGCVFQNYLQNASANLIQKLQDDIRLNLFLNTDLKNEQYPNEILKILDSFFKKIGRFPAINELTVIPKGDVPIFVNSNDAISPSELYEKFNLENSRGLVCVYFLAVLNIHLGGEKIIPKNAMSEFYHNVSMQALSKSNDEIFFNFLFFTDFDQLIFVANEQTYNKKNKNQKQHC